MGILLSLKKPFVWVKRFGNRCGHGVHSPFAFDFITTVIYEKTPYYAYHELKQKSGGSTCPPCGSSGKINRLLFRLVNRVQPGNIIDAGNHSSAALYLQYAKKGARYVSVEEWAGYCPEEEGQVDFLYLHNYADPVFVEKIFFASLPYAHEKTLFVIEGIHRSAQMKALWKRAMEDERVGITFDLYDLGILFFDRTKLKQHYVVNF